ncbi:MAG: hypothetical protein OEM46_00945 [Ignavibacteria bacterium]|nr:hypothetical protein [Ignavibacteria bacterium]
MRIEVITITILSFLNFISCGYRIESFNPNEYNEFEKENGKPSEICVELNDSVKYHFADWGYNILNDTLYGNGIQVINDSDITVNGKIPINEVKSISVERPNRGYYFIGFLTIVVPIAILISWAIAWNNN